MKIPALNDSKEIGMCIYNVVILSIVTLVLSLALKDNVTMKFATVSLFVIVGTTMTQCLIFVPKVCHRLPRVQGASRSGTPQGAQSTV